MTVNLFGVTLQLNEKYQNVDTGVISSDIILRIKQYLRYEFSLAYDAMTFDRDITPYVSAAVYEEKSSKYTTQLEKWLRQHCEIKLLPSQKTAIGNFIGARDAGGLLFDITDEFEWNAGDFGDGGSCYFSPQRPARQRLMDSDAYAFRSFRQDGKGNSRCWALANRPEYPDHLFIFNGYGIRSSQWAQRIVDFFASHNVTLHANSTHLKVGQSDGPIYMNGDTYVIAPVQTRLHDTYHVSSNIHNYWWKCAVSGKFSNDNDIIRQVNETWRKRLNLPAGYSVHRDHWEEAGFYAYGSDLYPISHAVRRTSMDGQYLKHGYVPDDMNTQRGTTYTDAITGEVCHANVPSTQVIITRPDGTSTGRRVAIHNLNLTRICSRTLHRYPETEFWGHSTFSRHSHDPHEVYVHNTSDTLEFIQHWLSGSAANHIRLGLLTDGERIWYRNQTIGFHDGENSGYPIHSVYLLDYKQLARSPIVAANFDEAFENVWNELYYTIGQSRLYDWGIPSFRLNLKLRTITDYNTRVTNAYLTLGGSAFV